MKNKKIIGIIILLIIVVCLLVCLFACTNKEKNNEGNGNLANIQQEEQGKYIKEDKQEELNMRLLESESKDYVTLLIETNIFEGEKPYKIQYNNQKYILNTANPLLDNVEIEKTNKISSFELKLEELQNYSIIFIKKDPKSSTKKEDIKISPVV